MENFYFSHTLTVRYAEIDVSKTVFNAHYLTYFDTAVSKYFRDGLKLNSDKLMSGGLFDTVLAKATIDFKKPAFYDDELTIWCRTSKMGNTSMTVEFIIVREDESDVIATSEIIYVHVDQNSLKPKRIPDEIRERVQQLEKRTFD